MSRLDAPTVRRMVSALGRQARDGDAEDLAALLGLAEHIDAVIGETVTHMREVQGITWATIATASGTTRQAAQMRWGKRK